MPGTGALGKRDRRHAAAWDLHEPADTEPGRKPAGTVVILAADTIGALCRTLLAAMGFTSKNLRVLTAGLLVNHHDFSSARSAAMPRAVWLFTAPRLIPIAPAISASDRPA